MVVVHPSAVEFKYQNLGSEDEKLQPAMTAWASNVQTVIDLKLGRAEACQIFPPGKLLSFRLPKILLAPASWMGVSNYTVILY